MGFLYMGYRIRREKALAEAASSTEGSEPDVWKEGSQAGSHEEEATTSGGGGGSEGDRRSGWMGRIGKMIGRGNGGATATAGENRFSAVSEMGLKKQPGPTSTPVG